MSPGTSLLARRGQSQQVFQHGSPYFEDSYEVFLKPLSSQRLTARTLYRGAWFLSLFALWEINFTSSVCSLNCNAIPRLPEILTLLGLFAKHGVDIFSSDIFL